MAISTYTIAASLDDSHYDNGLDACYNTETFLCVTAYTEGYPQYTGLRFLAVSEGNGAKVTAAYLRLQAADNGLTNTVRIRGILQTSPANWAPPNCNPDDRPVTVAYADWVTGARTQGEWYNSADIAAVVQELLDQPGRVAGSAIAFMLSSTGGPDANFLSWDWSDHSGAPQLVITWQPKAVGYML